ncbi:DCN1-like protein [Diplonema papillatum]|nr:DCN1-like protein [Diplonema papillatum]
MRHVVPRKPAYVPLPTRSNAVGCSHMDSAADAELQTLFERYKAYGVQEGGDPAADAIQGKGLVLFCEDLGVDPFSDVLVLIIAWLLKAEESYQFTRTEFVTGFKRLSACNLDAMRRSAPGWRRLAVGEREWPQFYLFCFSFSKPASQRLLETDGATELWQLLMRGDRAWDRLEDWFGFLARKGVRGITKDVWQQFPEFARTPFEGFDFEGGAWPVLFDEFVAATQNAPADG